MNVIKKLRKECGLSQEELAKSVHVTQTAVSQWETGRHYPDMRQAIELADFFGVTTDYLLGRNTPKNLETFARTPAKVETFSKAPTKVEVFPRTKEIESAQKEKAPDVIITTSEALRIMVEAKLGRPATQKELELVDAATDGLINGLREQHK